MKTSKAVRSTVAEMVKNQSSISAFDIEKLILDDGKMPSYESLVNSELRRTTNRLLASFKGPDNVRYVFGICDGSGTYVPMQNCKDVQCIDAIKDQLSKRAAGTYKSIAKAELQRIEAVRAERMEKAKKRNKNDIPEQRAANE